MVLYNGERYFSEKLYFFFSSPRRFLLKTVITHLFLKKIHYSGTKDANKNANLTTYIGNSII